MRIGGRLRRLEDAAGVAPPALTLEEAEALEPAEHERLFGYRIITRDMTAKEAARHYQATLFAMEGQRHAPR